MALRPIIILPDPKLRFISEKVERVDGALKKLMDICDIPTANM